MEIGVVVEDDDQLVELEVPGERDRLVADALHQAAVAGNHVGVVVDDGVAEPRIEEPLRQRHAHGIAEALAQRTRGRLDARRVPELGMPRRLGAQLPEARQLIHAHAGVAGEMQERVEQHRAVARRQHEAVAVRPVGCRGIELQEPGEQHGRHVGHAHGHAGMAAFGLLHRVHGQRPDGVRHVLVRDCAVLAHSHRHIRHARPRLPAAFALCGWSISGLTQPRPAKGTCKPGDRSDASTIATLCTGLRIRASRAPCVQYDPIASSGRRR